MLYNIFTILILTTFAFAAPTPQLFSGEPSAGHLNAPMPPVSSRPEGQVRSPLLPSTGIVSPGLTLSFLPTATSLSPSPETSALTSDLRASATNTQTEPFHARPSPPVPRPTLSDSSPSALISSSSTVQSTDVPPLSIPPFPVSSRGSSLSLSTGSSVSSLAPDVATTTSSSEFFSPPTSVVSASTALSAQPSSVSSSSTGLHVGALSTVYLDKHNVIRAEHGAAPLVWSQNLADKAQSWADGCQLRHSAGALGPVGENLAAATGIFTAESAVNLFVSDQGASTLSHFTQVVWKSTTQLGCAVASCDGLLGERAGPATYHVCLYDPVGNVIGEEQANIQL